MGKAYEAAPIVGCVIEVKFNPPLSDSAVTRIAAKLARHYQHRQDLRTETFRLEVATKAVEFEKPNPVMVFSSRDQTERLTLQVDGFLIEQLAPYPGGDTLFSRFARDWVCVDKVTKRRAISRIGMRFINRIDMPLSAPATFPNAYVTIGMSVPSQFARTTAASLNFQAEFGDRPLKLILNTGLGPSPIPDKHAVVIDIDVISEKSPPQATEEIFALFGEMRQVKNDIFEECVTNVARSTFR